MITELRKEFEKKKSTLFRSLRKALAKIHYWPCHISGAFQANAFSGRGGGGGEF